MLARFDTVYVLYAFKPHRKTVRRSLLRTSGWPLQIMIQHCLIV